MKNKVQFLNLGKHPITNNFLIKKNPKKEFFYNLKLIFYNKSKLVSLAKFVPPKKMFNEKYAHRASASRTMSLAYSNLAKSIKNKFKPKSILEIGSNDGVFIKHFKKIKNLGVEPCKNLARITSKIGIKTYDEFWTFKTARKIVNQIGKVDVIYLSLIHI